MKPKSFFKLFLATATITLTQISCQSEPKPESNTPQRPPQVLPVTHQTPNGIPFEAFGGAMPDSERELQFAQLNASLSSVRRQDFTYAEDMVDAAENILRSTSAATYLTRSDDRLTIVAQLRDGSPWFFNAGKSFPRDQWYRPRSLGIKLFSTTEGNILSNQQQSYRNQTVSAITTTAPGPSDDRDNKPGDSYLPRGRNVQLQNCLRLGDSVELRLNEFFTQKNYNVSRGTCRLNEFRSLSNMDFLWVSTHGIPFQLKINPAGDTVQSYLMITGEPFKTCAELPAQQCAQNRSDIQSLRIVSGKIDDNGNEGWGITENFVKEYWSFNSTRSAAILDGCESFGRPVSNGIDDFAASYRSALGQKGAGLVLGWLGQVWQSGGDRVIKKLIDYSLGLNLETQLSPKFRPSMMGDAYSYMHEKNEAQDNSPNGYAKFQFEPQRLVLSGLLLAPTISTVIVDSYQNRIRIQGDFGDEKGQVTVSDIPLANISEWKPHQIIATLPKNGPASSGPVQVNVRGVKSNTVPITEWNGTVSITSTLARSYGSPGPKLTANCSLRFREDIHLSRSVLRDHPHRNNENLTLSPSEWGTSCQWSWSDQGVDSSNHTTTITISGPSSAPTALEAIDGFTFSLLANFTNRTFMMGSLSFHPTGRVVTRNSRGQVVLDEIRTFGLNWQRFIGITFPFNPDQPVFRFQDSKSLSDSNSDPGTQQIEISPVPATLPNSDTEA